MKRLLIALSMSIVTVYAGDIRTNDGTVYKNAKITSHTPADVTIVHQSGIAHVPLSEMPAEVQRQFNYDPEKSAQYRAAEIAADKASVRQSTPIAVQSAVPRESAAPAVALAASTSVGYRVSRGEADQPFREAGAE